MAEAKETGINKSYTISGKIAANKTGIEFSKDMDGSVIFNCQEIRGVFTTLIDIAGVINDFGVNGLSFKIIDGGTDYQFFDNYIPMEMLLSPGRKLSSKAANIATAEPVNAIYKAFTFPHRFTKKFVVAVTNSSNTEQEFSITFTGKELKRVG